MMQHLRNLSAFAMVLLLVAVSCARGSKEPLRAESAPVNATGSAPPPQPQYSPAPPGEYESQSQEAAAEGAPASATPEALPAQLRAGSALAPKASGSDRKKAAAVLRESDAPSTPANRSRDAKSGASEHAPEARPTVVE